MLILLAGSLSFDEGCQFLYILHGSGHSNPQTCAWWRGLKKETNPRSDALRPGCLKPGHRSCAILLGQGPPAKKEDRAVDYFLRLPGLDEVALGLLLSRREPLQLQQLLVSLRNTASAQAVARPTTCTDTLSAPLASPSGL